MVMLEPQRFEMIVNHNYWWQWRRFTTTLQYGKESCNKY